MTMPGWAKAAALAFVCWSAWHAWHDRAANAPPGVLAPQDPVQSDLVGARPLVHGDWTLQPRARYEITARVLGRETYAWDAFASAAPVDVALGWGLMSDSAVLAPLEITQGARFYSVRWRSDPPAPPERLLQHSANVHTIPADRGVERRLRALRVGQVVRLEGLLVDGARPDGATFRTSTTRTDTGAGACEVLLVERVEVLPARR